MSTRSRYVVLDKKQISYVKKQHSRACTVFENYPQRDVLEYEIGTTTAVKMRSL